jgi:septum site-determining protein MinC
MDMTAIPKRSHVPALQFEIKAGFYTLPTLRVLSPDTDALDALLAERSTRAPEFFRNLPLVIDLSEVRELDLGAEFAVMIGMVRGYGLVPVGIRGGSPSQQEQAHLMELAVLPPSRGGTGKSTRPVAAPIPAVEHASAKIVDAPVRSGQRVYARGGDLVLLAPVSSGAEVMADGCIHAYAPVRGRVLAGVQGDEQARVFCTDLNAELVSVAGCYKVNEDLDLGLIGRPVQVFLEGEALRVRPM